MTLPRLIAFGGFAFSGKDTAADQLVERSGYVKTYMSKPLEQALLTLDPYINVGGTVGRYSWLHAKVGYDKSKENPEVRRLLQMLGTEVGRKTFGENCLVDMVSKEIVGYWWDGYSVCLTGVRYPNEMEMVRRSRGVSVWVSRPGYNAVNTHSSDNTLGPGDFDIQVINDGTPQDLYDKLFPMLWGEGGSLMDKICKNCHLPIRQINYLMGVEWMHINTDSGFPSTAKGTAWRYCKLQVAEPIFEVK